MTPFWAEDGSYKQSLSMTGRRIHYHLKVEDENSLLIYTQMVGEEAASSSFEGECGGDDEGKKRMEPDKEGVLRLEGGLSEDDLDSLNDLFH